LKCAEVFVTIGIADVSGPIAKTIGYPHAEGLALMIEGMAATMEGRWRESLAPSRAGEAILRDDAAASSGNASCRSSTR